MAQYYFLKITRVNREFHTSKLKELIDFSVSAYVPLCFPKNKNSFELTKKGKSHENEIIDILIKNIPEISRSVALLGLFIF